jgi:integrase/recombinase XerD
LFFSAKRGGFSAQTIVNLFAHFYALAGIKGASSHSGRRQFLTELVDKGINVRVIQALRGTRTWAQRSDTLTTMKASC